MKAPWYTRGNVGALLHYILNTRPGPFVCKRCSWDGGALICAANGRIVFSVTLRGSSKCRRKARRELERYLNADFDQPE